MVSGGVDCTIGFACMKCVVKIFILFPDVLVPSFLVPPGK